MAMAITQAVLQSMLSALPNDPWFPSVCQLLRHDGTLTGDGQRDTDVSHWVSIGGSTDAIRCRKTPLILQRVSADERRHPDNNEVQEGFQVLLKGWFGSVVTYAERALIDGIVWQIDADEEPGNAIYTRFRIQKINL